MAEIRIPGYNEGSEIGGEPVNWLVIDTDTKERRVENNPNYVPPPPLTEIERAEWDVERAKAVLADAEGYLKELRDES